jgi:hypothetical protein
MSNLQADMPLVNVPFTGANGQIAEPWFIFLLQLWRRTGGATPPNGNLTVADVIGLDQTFSPLQVQKDGISAFETTFAPAIPADAQPPSDVVVSRPADVSSLVDMVFPVPAPDIADQTFSSGTDFTAGTTTALTLNTSFTSAARLWVFFDAAFQGDDQYSLSGTTLTFTSAIPVGTNKVYVKGLK